MSEWNLGEIDTTEVEVGGRTLPTPGEYEVKVLSAEYKDTKAGDGKYVNAHFGIKNGGSFWYKFNIINKNPSTQSQAKRRLTSMLIAFGMTKEQIGQFDAKDLFSIEGCECMMKIKHGKDSGNGYGPGIEIEKMWKKDFGTSTAKPSTVASSSQSKSPFG